MDQSTDALILIKLLEQATQVSCPVDTSKLTQESVQELLKTFVDLLREAKSDLESQSPEQLKDFCLSFMKSFFEGKLDILKTTTLEEGKEEEEEVNDIIMKIELKKFQKLIENRIQRKNTLLNSDTHRLFPLCNQPLSQQAQKTDEAAVPVSTLWKTQQQPRSQTAQGNSRPKSMNNLAPYHSQRPS